MTEHEKDKIDLAGVRLLMDGLSIGEVAAAEVGHLNRDDLTAYLTKIARFHIGRLSSRQFQWRFVGDQLRLRRNWDTMRDKWGLSQLQKDIPTYLSAGTAIDSLATIRATASRLRRQCGLIIKCKVNDGRLVVMLTGQDPLPQPQALMIKPAPMTAEEFERIGNGRTYKYAIDELAPGESRSIPLDDWQSAGSIRVYCHYHGKRLGRKFRVNSTNEGHTITRTA